MSKKDKKRSKKFKDVIILKYVDNNTLQIGSFKKNLVGSNPNTWYYVFIIEKTWIEKIKSFFKKGYEGNTDFLFSEKKGNPPCPKGYKVKRRISGAILTDSKNDITSFTQR